MSILLDEFKKEIDDIGISIDTNDICLPTGFDVLDYANAKIIENNDSRIIESGIEIGSIVTFIGLSGVGKSALVQQIASNITKKYNESNIIYCDAERKGMSYNRALKLSKMNKDIFDEKFIRLKKGLNTESLFDLLVSIKQTKLKNEKNILTTINNIENIYPPTIVIIDSLAVLYPEAKRTKKIKGTNQKEIIEEFEGSMAATATAKANSQFFGKAISICDDANINLFVINHINDNVSINPYDRKPSKIPYLKQGEAIPGGSKPLYLSTYVFKLSAVEKFKKDELYGFSGFHVNLEICKTRGNRSGRIVKLVYNQKLGFDNILSNFILLKEYNMIKGSGHGYFINGINDYKFKIKDLKKLYSKEKDFRVKFKKIMNKILLEMAVD